MDLARGISSTTAVRGSTISAGERSSSRSSTRLQPSTVLICWIDQEPDRDPRRSREPRAATVTSCPPDELAAALGAGPRRRGHLVTRTPELAHGAGAHAAHRRALAPGCWRGTGCRRRRRSPDAAPLERVESTKEGIRLGPRPISGAQLDGRRDRALVRDRTRRRGVDTRRDGSVAPAVARSVPGAARGVADRAPRTRRARRPQLRVVRAARPVATRRHRGRAVVPLPPRNQSAFAWRGRVLRKEAVFRHAGCDPGAPGGGRPVAVAARGRAPATTARSGAGALPGDVCVAGAADERRRAGGDAARERAEVARRRCAVSSALRAAATGAGRCSAGGCRSRRRVFANEHDADAGHAGDRHRRRHALDHRRVGSQARRRGPREHAAYFVQDYEPWFYPEEERRVARACEADVRADPAQDRDVGVAARAARSTTDTTSRTIPLGLDLGFFYPRPGRAPRHARSCWPWPGPVPPPRFDFVVATLAQGPRRRCRDVDIVLFGEQIDSLNLPFPYRSAGVVTDHEELARLYSSARCTSTGPTSRRSGSPRSRRWRAARCRCSPTPVASASTRVDEENCLLVRAPRRRRRGRRDPATALRRGAARRVCGKAGFATSRRTR